MNKNKVDKLTVEYQKKIFGFAMEKTQDITEAEEIAADIVYEVYKSLLAADDIANIDGYVYRIARNVFAKFLDKRSRQKNLNMLDIPYAVYEKGFDRLEDEEVYQSIRREIGLLS